MKNTGLLSTGETKEYPNMYLNKTVFSGRLVHTPELIDSKGSKLIQFNLHQEREYFSRGQQYVEDNWKLCEAWKSYALDIVKNFKEGDIIKVEGYSRNYRGKDVLMVEKYEKVTN